MPTQYYYPLEAPSGIRNGVNKVFTTSKPYIAATLRVFRDGILLYKDIDYTETAPTTGTFTMTTAPASDDQLRVDFFSTVGVTGISPDWFDTKEVLLYSMIDTRVYIDTQDKDSPNVIFFDGVGTRLRVYTGVDLTAASAVSLKVEKPSGEITSWVGFIDANNPYYILYTIAVGDFDLEGEYLVSAEATINSVVSRGTLDSFIGQKQYLSQI